ncbi:MAG: GEVED domain-containing protein [Planctomycetota bacterium]
MKTFGQKFLLAVACVSMASAGQAALGDWSPGDACKMHYPQRPDPNGWDVCLRPMAVADDFRCRETGPITGIHFWISWKDDIVDEVLDWAVSIFDNVVVNGRSQPGRELWRFKEGEITVVAEEPSLQGWLCPCAYADGEQLQAENHRWYALVNITRITEPFVQQEGAIYWLVIRANATIYESPRRQPEVGWKTSVDHYGSPGMWIKWPVSENSGWAPVATPGNIRSDMAFVITGEAGPPPEMDFGDADETKCDNADLKCNSYPTTLARNGARHIINPSIYLGHPYTDVIHIDAEPDGQPTAGADGDDNNGADDEDGVFLPDLLKADTVAAVEILVSADGFIDAWIDFNADGDWDDRGERIFFSEPVTLGSNMLKFFVPPVAGDTTKETYARFRFSTTGSLNYYGLAHDGEVEDYLVKVQGAPQPELDFGDTPDGDFAPSGYPTLLITNGARHRISPWVRLGRYIDGERDGQPSTHADGDDINGLDDEDGVYFGGPLIPGTTVEVKVIASVEGFLNAWVDFSADGDWDDPGDRIFADEPLHGGVNYLKFTVAPVPAAAADSRTYARFRFTTYRNAHMGYAGFAEDGEVEDYPVEIEPPQPAFDFGDAPELRCDDPAAARCNAYPTTLARNGARHIVFGNIYLGDPYTDAVHIDAEPDGQPTLLADGDDTNGFDDEDGVEFISPLVPGFPAKVMVLASVEGYVEAWIDFNGDGDWDDVGEQIFASEAVVEGTNYLEFKVPPYPHAIPANIRTYARFRFSTHGGLRYLGPARNGEVEDYLVRIEEPERLADLGDAPDSSNNYNVDMTAYTSQGPLPVIVKANYPSVYKTGSPPHGPIHWNPYLVAQLGGRVTLETEADFGYDQDPTNNIIPPKDVPNLDNADDAVRVPLTLPHCRWTRFDYVVSVVRPARVLYVNVWLDWNRDGDWDDTLNCFCEDTAALAPAHGLAREWAVRNQLLPELPPGIHRISTPGFLPWHPYPGPIWMRITLSERPWSPLSISSRIGHGGSGPKEGYWIGETEDYFFIPRTRRLEYADLDSDLRVDFRDFAILASQWLKEIITEETQ